MLAWATIHQQTLSVQSRANFWKSLQTLTVTRIVIALVLMVFLSFDGKAWLGAGSVILDYVFTFYLTLAVVFALLAIYVRRRFLLQLMTQAGCDIVFIALLYLSAGGARSGLAMLYLFPLAGAAILAPLSLALLCAALVTLFLLAESVYQTLMLHNVMALMPAGLSGAAMFAAVLLVSRLASRLIGQEELAVQRGLSLDVLHAINRLVIADIDDGIVVVGRDGQILTVNPAAGQMLGLASEAGIRLPAAAAAALPPERLYCDWLAGAGPGTGSGTGPGITLSGVPALQPIAQAYAHWLAAPGDHERSVVFVTIRPSFAGLAGDTGAQGAQRSVRREPVVHLKARFAAVDTGTLDAQRSVIFLQDVTAIENQAQQLKLAAMGRLTASIAHEVRNPLAAISHATSLLGDDLNSAVHVRLLKIVGDNVGRVNRMVEDILQLSRKVHAQHEPVNLGYFLFELKAEFEQTHALADDVILLEPVGDATVHFDALHLREIVLNLLANAVRYASGAPGSMRLSVLIDALGRCELHVQDDGPAIALDVLSHLFEPFYTTSNKGAGLGLYLARELCLNNGAMLDYEYRRFGELDSGRFVVAFAARRQAPIT
jgi:two-component system sensor histidine kinase PilS (NtrC family)